MCDSSHQIPLNLWRSFTAHCLWKMERLMACSSPCERSWKKVVFRWIEMSGTRRMEQTWCKDRTIIFFSPGWKKWCLISLCSNVFAIHFTLSLNMLALPSWKPPSNSFTTFIIISRMRQTVWTATKSSKLLCNVSRTRFWNHAKLDGFLWPSASTAF